MMQDDRTAKAPTPAEEIVDGTDGELTDEQLDKVAGGSGTISNLANMRHEMLKTVANNLRS